MQAMSVGRQEEKPMEPEEMDARNQVPQKSVPKPGAHPHRDSRRNHRCQKQAEEAEKEETEMVQEQIQMRER